MPIWKREVSTHGKTTLIQISYVQKQGKRDKREVARFSSRNFVDVIISFQRKNHAA